MTLSDRGMVRHNRPGVSDSFESSQCQAIPSDREKSVDTDVDETIRDVEEVGYSTDNSSIIENPDQHRLTPRLDEFNRFVALVKSEGHKIETEIVTHEIAGMATGSETCKLS